MSQLMCFGFKKALHLPQSGPHFPEPSLKLLFTGAHTIFESDIIGNMIDALKRLFQDDWVTNLNVEDFLGLHFDDMTKEVQKKWINTSRSFIMVRFFN